MFVKSDIRKVTVALEKGLAREAYIRIGNAGIIHPARLEAGDDLTDAGIQAEEAMTQNILAQSGFALKALNLDPGDDEIAQKQSDTKSDAAWAAGLKETVEHWLRLRARIEEKKAALALQLEYAEALALMGIDPSSFTQARLVRMVFGTLTDALPDLSGNKPFVVAAAGRYICGAALPVNAPEMFAFLRASGFIDKTAAVGGKSLSDLEARKKVLERRMDALERYRERLREEKGPALILLHQSYRGYEEVIRAMRLSQSSRKILFITGWMDIKDKPALIAILLKLCGNRFVVSDARNPEAPVRLRNNRFFRPFELVVKMMGMPAQSEMDPTPLAALTFVVVFGLMFGDLGQGLVLAAAGMILKFIARRKANEELAQTGVILTACGLSAAFCGILYGSLFSSSHLIPAFWRHPAENIAGLFFTTIFIGAIVILVGLCLNIINAFINADYSEAFLEKRSMVVLILYGATVFMTVRYWIQEKAPGLWEISLFIVLPLIIFSLRGFLAQLFFKAEKPGDIFGYAAETVVAVVEIALGMLANTVSFIRVGAFALSHAGLSMVTYTLAGIADPALNSAGAIAILISGNLFIICFEGLVCGIQSMRLEYYEFFSKFYKGDGVAFSPFTLKAKMSEV